MIARELPPTEWGRLAGTYLEPIRDLLIPGEARILVVEDDGRIVGTWGLYRPFHVDGVSVDPAHQGKGVVARLLLETMQDWIAETGARAVLTSAQDAKVARLLTHLGAHPLEGTMYLWPRKG